MDEPQKYEAHLQTLGAKHVMYEADIGMIEALAQAMVDNVHQILKRQVKVIYKYFLLKYYYY